MKIIACVITLGLFLAVCPAFGQDAFDGTKPLICASIEALDCDPGAACTRGIPEAMGAPKFVRIDFEKKEITGPVQTTKIRSVEIDDYQIVLQGYDTGLGWTLAIDRTTGNTRTTFAGGNAAFIVFGSCTAYP